MAGKMEGRLPSVDKLRELEAGRIEEVLDLLFEPSRGLHSLLVPEIKKSTSLTSYSDLVSLAKRSLLSLPTDSSILLDILSSHPRLGATKVDSTQSQNEQQSLGNEVERRELETLNEVYEARFPGLRYVVFVDGRSREVIMRDMRGRIDGSTREEEILRASEAMCDIAVDRARKLGAE
jgi:2-oxo-4-hydroxy-4-carboxy--5-ureidoimidazoline (OHCU) decarboxylase